MSGAETGMRVREQMVDMGESNKSLSICDVATLEMDLDNTAEQ